MSEQLHFDLGLPSWSKSAVKRLLGLKRAEKLIFRLRAERGAEEGPAAFCRRALRALGVSYELPAEQLEPLKSLQGPVILAANHPLGALDALVMMTLMGEIRSDFRFVGNSILEALPELGPALLPVHIMGSDAHPAANVARVRSILGYLRRDGMVGIFPAGEVAAFDRLRCRKPDEREWHAHLGRIAMKSRATVVPLFFEGRNSLIFQYLGLVLPPLRIALLAREMLNYRKPVRFKLGRPIAYSEHAGRMDSGELTGLFRRRTFDLGALARRGT